MHGEQREVYAKLENQIEIILQDESIFNIEESSYFVSYKEDSNIEEQGQKVMLNLTDTIGDLRTKVAEIVGGEEYTLL